VAARRAQRVAQARAATPVHPTRPSPPSKCASTSLWAVRPMTQAPKKSAGRQRSTETIENCPAGVGVPGASQGRSRKAAHASR
jgi:hypothetical protein